MPNPHHHDPVQAAWRAEAILIRRRLIRLQDESCSLRRTLARKYNPNQPRVSAGNANGGQWTDGSASGGGSAGSFADFGIGLSLGDFGSLGESAAGLVPAVDPTGDDEVWSSYAETTHADGSLDTTGVTHRDGGRIYSEYAKPGEASDWDERHTVTLPEGDKVTFETAGKTQTIREGGPDGPILSRTTWTPNGPEPEATVQSAFAPAVVVVAPAVVAAGTVLFGWLSLQEIERQRTVMGFAPRDYWPTQSEGKIDLNYVGKLTSGEAELACKRMPQVQSLANRAASAAGPANQFSPQAYGDHVHKHFEKFVNDLHDINFRAERSFLKEGIESPAGERIYYGYPGSIRVDAYEYNPESGTLCVYDLKTGRRGMSNTRSDIYAKAISMGFNNVRRIVLIEIRPKV